MLKIAIYESNPGDWRFYVDDNLLDEEAIEISKAELDEIYALQMARFKLNTKLEYFKKTRTKP